VLLATGAHSHFSWSLDAMRTMKNYFLILLTLVILSCQPTTEQENSNLVELQQDSLRSDFSSRFNNSNFNDSLCNEGIELAKKLAKNDFFRFYDMEGSMDSSSTPTVILRDDLNFKILGGYDKNMSLRYCYNQATLNFFKDQKGFNAFDYVKSKYDSLFELGLTEEPPNFNDEDPLTEVPKYFYCNMDLTDATPGEISVYFKINEFGEPTDIELHEASGNPLDSVTYQLIKNMPKWKPANSLTGENVSGWDYTFRFEYSEEEAKKHCI
jgi:hypothetical protein